MEIFLPCSEDLWSSPHRQDWEAKYKLSLKKRQSTETLKFGILKTSQQLGQVADGTALSEDLKDWSSHVDGFGVTVLMTALTLVI